MVNLPLNLIQSFREIGFCTLPLSTEKGVMICIHEDRMIIQSCKNREHSINVEILDVDGFPLIRVVVMVVDRPGEPFIDSFFLDVFNLGHAIALDRLTDQEFIPVGWYDEKFRLIKLIEVPWQADMRSHVAKTIAEAHVMAEKDPEKYKHYFSIARKKYLNC